MREFAQQNSFCKTPCTLTTYDIRPTQMNNRTIIEINFDFDLEVGDFLPTLFNLVFRLTLPGSSLASQSGMSSQAWVGRSPHIARRQQKERDCYIRHGAGL